MKRKVAIVGVLVASVGAAIACSSSNDLGGAGAPCILFSDCQTNLVCGKGVCTADPTLVGMAEPNDKTPDTGVEGDGTLPVVDGAPAQDTGTTGGPDATTEPDTGSNPPVDAGKPNDSGGAADVREEPPPAEPDAGEPADAGQGD